MMHGGMNGGGGTHGEEKSAVTAFDDGDAAMNKIPALANSGKTTSLVVGSHSPRSHASPQPSPSSTGQFSHPSSTRKDMEESGIAKSPRPNGPTSGGDGGEDGGDDSRTDSAFGERTDQRISSAGDVDDYNADGEGEDNSSNPSNDPGKMFIGGLSWQTTAEGLRDYFSKFGEVNECMVMRDPATKRARGFGFITFVDPNSVDKVLTDENHVLDGKKIDPKIAFPKRPQPKMVMKTKKVFIGGLSSNSTIDDMKAYFQQFGKIDEAMLMYDKTTQRHRGFGFITFDDDEVSDRVCEIHFHEINGKMVECKKAQPKEVMLPVQMNKNRAAAARNLYGLAPEQLLAFANFMPRVTAASPYSTAAAGIPFYPGMAFNGMGAHPQPFCLSPSGRSSVSNTNNGATLSSAGSSSLLRCPVFDLTTVQQVQMAAQQQAAMLEATSYAAYANAMAEQFSPPQFHPTTSTAAHHHSHHHLQQQQPHHPQQLHHPTAIHPHQHVQHAHHQQTQQHAHPLTPTGALQQHHTHNILQHPQQQGPPQLMHQTVIPQHSMQNSIQQHMSAHHAQQAPPQQTNVGVFGASGGNKI